MSLVFLCVRNLHAEHVRNQNGQINCKIILIYICFFFLIYSYYSHFRLCKLSIVCFYVQLCETHTCVSSLQSDYHFEYTECDVLGSRWRVAVPNKADICTGLPDPVKGTQCSKQ